MSDNDRVPGSAHLALESILDEYSQDRSLRPASKKHYLKVIQRFEKMTGIRYLDEITYSGLRKWRSLLLSRSSPTNWNNNHRHLRAVLGYCVKHGLMAENPLDRIKQSTRANTRRKACSIEDFTKVIDYLQNDTTNPEMSTFSLNMILVLYYTGIRRSQLCGLVWSDINFTEQTILLRKTHSKTALQWIIALHEDLHDVLLSMKSRIKDRLGASFSENDQVFLVQRYNRRFRGDRLHPDQITGIMRRLAKKTGTDFSAHMMRHMVATMLANQHTDGKTVPSDLVAIKDLLGHGDIKTTVGYIESNLSTQRELLKALKSPLKTHPKKSED